MTLTKKNIMMKTWKKNMLLIQVTFSLNIISKTFLGLIAYSSQTVEKLENRLIAKVEACKTLSFTKQVTSFIHL